MRWLKTTTVVFAHGSVAVSLGPRRSLAGLDSASPSPAGRPHSSCGDHTSGKGSWGLRQGHTASRPSHPAGDTGLNQPTCKWGHRHHLMRPHCKGAPGRLRRSLPPQLSPSRALVGESWAFRPHSPLRITQEKWGFQEKPRSPEGDEPRPCLTECEQACVPIRAAPLRVETPCLLWTVRPRRDKHLTGNMVTARDGVVPRVLCRNVAELMLVP